MPEKPLAKKYEGCNFLELERRDEAVNQTETPEQGEGARTLTARERAVRARNVAIPIMKAALSGKNTEGSITEKERLAKIRESMELMDPEGMTGTGSK